MILEAGFALFLTTAVLILSGSVGSKFIGYLDSDHFILLEKAIFSILLGLGVIAYGVLALGLMGQLRLSAILLWLTGLSLWTYREWYQILVKLPTWQHHLLDSFPRLHPIRKIILLIGISIFLLTLLLALTPAWDVDGLLYHLQGPRLFLEAERIKPISENWLTFYPFTVEMLFTLGMGLGSDMFPKLVVLAFAVLFIVSTYSFSLRFIGEKIAWLSAAILIGIPIIPIWASISYNDIAWAAYTLSAIYVVYLAFEHEELRLMVLGGLFVGLGMGIKYLALGTALSIGIWIIWIERKQGWLRTLKRAGCFGFAALIVASPWYIKNLIWTGNPIYPLILQPQGWSYQRIQLWTSYMDSFGTGSGLLDYIFAPINLYIQHERYATFMGSIEVPSFLFVIVIFYPFAHRIQLLNRLLVLVGLQFGIWLFGAQQTRYLLPLFPLMAILSGYTMVDLGERAFWRKWWMPLENGLVIGMLVVTLIYIMLFFLVVRPLGVLVGFESKDDFLRRRLGDYAAIQYIRSNLSADDRVLMMWDGRGYYCDERCLPDVDHSQWTELVLKSPDNIDIAHALKGIGVTHVLFSHEDADFILQHDPDSKHQHALDFFFNEYEPVCTKEIYHDDWARLYELTCP